MSTIFVLDHAAARNADLIRKAEATALVRLAKVERKRALRARRSEGKRSSFVLESIHPHRAVHA